ncbi:hypothetical protein GCM10009856_56940 [Mycolicibacterium llatzerense]
MWKSMGSVAELTMTDAVTLTTIKAGASARHLSALLRDCPWLRFATNPAPQNCDHPGRHSA